MAKLSSDGKYCIVEKGDSLSKICSQFSIKPNNETTWDKLRTINKLTKAKKSGKIVYYIYPNQKIYFEKSNTSSSTKVSVSNKATITAFDLQADVDKTLFATWTCPKPDSEVEEYTTEWQYLTKDNVWMHTGETSTKYKYSTCSIPANATKVRFRVLPVAKKKQTTKNGKTVETTPWTLEWTDRNKQTFIVANEIPPDVPGQPSIEIDGYKMTITLEGITSDATHIEFKVIQDDTKDYKANGLNKNQPIKKLFAGADGRVSIVIDVAAGHEYKACCRAVRGTLKSGWSAYSSSEGTKPSAPSAWVSYKAISDTEVYLAWKNVSNAIGYDVQYTTKETYFDNTPDQVKSHSVDTVVGHTEITGLESGQTYYFRVRAKNDDGESAWTKTVSITIGKPPAAPTTWSSTTTVISGEPLTLYWVHCSEDNSTQTLAELTLTIDGVKRVYDIKVPGEHGINSSGSLYLIDEFTDEDEKGKTNSCVVDTTKFTEGAKIQWSVRTAGITKVYGDMSIERTVDVYAPPTLELDIFKVDGDNNVSISTVESFPFYISALAGPPTQTPIGYHVSVTAESTYEATDTMGNPKTIRAGEPIYSKYFDTTDKLLVELSASNIDLENGMEYSVNVTVSMDSGLTSENSRKFSVSWVESTYAPNVEIALNIDSYTASLRPYCEEITLHYYRVTKSSRTYTLTTEELEEIYGDLVENVETTTGEQVYRGMTSDGEDVYYSIVAESTIVENVKLSIYRREFDGTFTEIATGLDNTKNTYVTDPHPSLDYARYRIVATDTITGAIGYYDAPGLYVGGQAILIQWDEEWSSFDTFGSSDALVEPSWTGSLLTLPYNIDVSEGNSPDTAFIEYVGRNHPVGYYGTQLGETATWNTVIPKSDKDTLYALRRLKVWRGDCYVREPSGVGYWANVTVSFNQKHKDQTIPVTLNITRVEGGM